MKNKKLGKLTLFIGEFYSGKSTRLVKLANTFGKRNSILITTYDNDIYGGTDISRNVRYKRNQNRRVYSNLPEVSDIPKNVKYIFIDEFQQFRNIEMVNNYIHNGYIVYASGIISGKNPKTAYLLNIADKVIKVSDKNKHNRESVRVNLKDSSELLYNIAYIGTANPKTTLIHIDEDVDINKFYKLINDGLPNTVVPPIRRFKDIPDVTKRINIVITTDSRVDKIRNKLNNIYGKTIIFYSNKL